MALAEWLASGTVVSHRLVRDEVKVAAAPGPGAGSGVVEAARSVANESSRHLRARPGHGALAVGSLVAAAGHWSGPADTCRSWDRRTARTIQSTVRLQRLDYAQRRPVALVSRIAPAFRHRRLRLLPHRNAAFGCPGRPPTGLVSLTIAAWSLPTDCQAPADCLIQASDH